MRNCIIAFNHRIIFGRASFFLLIVQTHSAFEISISEWRCTSINSVSPKSESNQDIWSSQDTPRISILRLAAHTCVDHCVCRFTKKSKSFLLLVLTEYRSASHSSDGAITNNKAIKTQTFSSLVSRSTVDALIFLDAHLHVYFKQWKCLYTKSSIFSCHTNTHASVTIFVYMVLPDKLRRECGTCRLFTQIIIADM